MKKYSKTCIFCKVAKKEKKHFQIWENENCIAFLDHSPQTFGHTLVIPKKHVGYVFSLHENEYLTLLKAAEKVAKALQELTKCKRVCLGIYGFEINHTHVHLMPVNNLKELKDKIRKPSKKRQAEFAEKLKEIL
jgi:histidine triad (HIT) family protein